MLHGNKRLIINHLQVSKQWFRDLLFLCFWAKVHAFPGRLRAFVFEMFSKNLTLNAMSINEIATIGTVVRDDGWKKNGTNILRLRLTFK